MFLGRKQIVFYCLIFGLVVFLKQRTNKELSEEFNPPSDSPEKSIRFKPSVSPKSSFKLAGFDEALSPKAILKLKVGTGPSDVGISNENTLIGPGMIKKSDSGFMISDTFNNRILKLSKSGEQELEIAFPDTSLLQGFAENKRGDIWAIRREGSQLYLDQFNSTGRKLNTVGINTTIEEFKNYAGTFRSFFSNGEFYMANSSHILRVSENGKTKEVPGIPLESSKGVYISARQSPQKKFVIDLKTENSKIVKSFYAQGEYQSLSNIFSDTKGQIHLEFEHTFESESAESGKSVVTQSSIVETYNDEGKFIKDEMIEKSSDAEIDQDLDITEDGTLNHVMLKGTDFELYERLI